MSTVRPHLLALFTASVMTHVASGQDEFTIIALPDTQNYVNSAANAPLFTQQTQWIADEILVNGNPRNIRFVTHLGDVASDGDTALQYDRADTSMSVLETGPDGVVPYGVLPGNHDYASTGNKGTGTDLYVTYFGPGRFAGRTWYEGAEPSGNNSYQRFTGNGVEFIHIALEWQPTANVTNGPARDPSPIEWAQSVISANPGVPVIVSTHEYIDDDPPGRSSAGEAMFNELVRINDQIIMVLNGHFHSVGGTNDGEYHQVSQNDFGKDVVEVLQDYQDYPNGGDGWLRIITFDPDADAIHFETYSPVLDQFQTETVQDVGPFASQFTITMDFDQRFQFEPPPQPPAPVFTELTIRQGDDGYTGTEDKEVRADGADAANGQATEISIDGDDGSPGVLPSQGLFRFANIVGNGPNQIAPGTVIDDASLVLTLTNAGSGFDVHVMTTTWDETTTWVDLGGDGVTPGTEAELLPITSVGADDGVENVGEGVQELDVTSAVQAWVDGGANFGVALVPYVNGVNGILVGSSESTAPPALVVRTLLPGLELEAFTQDVDGYLGAADTQIRQADPTTSYASATSFSVDASDPSGNQNHVLLRFDDLFDAGLVPTDEDIVRAWLTVSASNPGAGGVLHRMLQAWPDTVTWSSGFGGDGIQADDVEAVATPESFIVGSSGTVEIDVTASLQAWQEAPSTNHGWVILPAGDDGWDFASSEAAAGDRPILTVVYDTSTCPQDVDGSGDVGATDLLQLLAEWGGPGVTDFDGSGTVDTLDLLLLLGAWGPCP